jgi:hypothetical protein
MSIAKLFEIVRILAILKYHEQQLMIDRAFTLIEYNKDKSPEEWILE